MKQIILFFCFLVVNICVYAQSTQNGYIVEYNGKKAKTPLANVEIKVKNAGSNVSDKKGYFTLSFRTLKPGDKIDVVSITKEGYEIFNKDALEAWRIANDGSNFTVILCKSASFKKLKDQYNAVASKSYAEQKKKEEANLAALLKEGKLQQTEYEKKLKELKDRYDEQLENLDNYIDQFARIDLSELSKEEQKIIEMVQVGKIDEAIKAYEDMKLEEKYAQAVQNINIADDAIKQFENVKNENAKAKEETYAAVRRMNEARRLQGGEDNYEKIRNSLRTVLLADTSDYNKIKEYADFLRDQTYYDEALKYYHVCEQGLINDSSKLFRIYNNIGVIYYHKKKFDVAENYYLKVNEILSKLVVKDPDQYTTLFYGIQNNLANVYNNQKQYSKALELQKRNIDIIDSIIPFDENNKIWKVKILNNIADEYRNLNEYVQSEDYFQKAQTYYFNEVPDSIKSVDIEYNINFNMGLLYECWDTIYYEKSEEYYHKALSMAEKMFDKNPVKYAQYVMLPCKRIRLIYYKQNDWEICKKWEKRMNTYLKILFSQNPDIYAESYAVSCMCLAEYSKLAGNLDEALIYIHRAIEIKPESPDYHYLRGLIYLSKEDYQLAKKEWEKVLSLSPTYLDYLIKMEGPTELHDILKDKGYIK